MTDSATDPFAADAAAIADAVDEIETMRSQEKRSALIKVALWVALGVAGIAMLVSGLEGIVATLGVLMAIAAFVAVFMTLSGAGRRVRQALSDNVMPILCRMAGGFEYDRTGRPGIDLREAQILPDGNRMPVEDQVSGTIGGVEFRSWDVAVNHETTDHENRTRTTRLFRGLVVEAGTGTARDLAVHLPRPSVAKFLTNLFKGGGETERRTVTAAGTQMEIDLHPGDYDMDALPGAIEEVVAALPEGARLEGILQREGRAYIAFATGRDHYAMGGLFTGRDALMAQVERAMGDLALPARVAATWAGAEAGVPYAGGARADAAGSGKGAPAA